jgi:hypothetical protein
MRILLVLIPLLLFVSSIAIGEDTMSITEFSVWNDSDASSWRSISYGDQNYIEFDTAFTADLPERTVDSTDYLEGDYYWLHMQCTCTYNITEATELVIAAFWTFTNDDEGWEEPWISGHTLMLGYQFFSGLSGSGSKTVGLRVRFPVEFLDVYSISDIGLRFSASVPPEYTITDTEEIYPIHLLPPPDPTSTPTPANTPTGTQTPTVTPTPTHDGTVIFHIYNHLNNEDPMTVVLGDNFPAYNWVERRTYPEDYPDEDAPFAHHFYVTRENMDFTYTTLRTYPTKDNSLKPGQIKYFPDGGESWLPSAGIDISVECRGYYLNSRAWALAAGNTSTDAVEINFVTPTPTNTPTNTPTPTKTPTPTPFCWIEYCPSDGVVKRIPLVEEEWKVAGKEYAAECIVNGITVSAPVINGASSSAAMEVYTDALHYFEEW